MKKTPIIMILSFFAVSFLLAGCSFFQKEDISVDTGPLVEIEEALVETGDIEEEEKTLVETGGLEKGEEVVEEVVEDESDNEFKMTVKDLIDERKDTLGSGDELTEEDIELMEDILNELVNAVE